MSTTRIDIRRQVAIAGRVTVAPAGDPAAGALVAIVSGPASFEEWLGWRAVQFGGSLDGVRDRSDQVRAAPDGHFHFLDLPAGHYGLSAGVPAGGTRYGTGSAEVDVAVGANGDITLARADLVIPATTLTGLVSDPAAAPLQMAAVRVAGTGETTFSGADGTFALPGVEAGPHTVAVSAAGRGPASIDVTLSRGEETHIDLTLQPAQ